jgi:hypothetical protein
MQWFLHACILCTHIFNGLIIFFASYLFLGTKLGFGSRLTNKVRSSLKLLSDHPNFVFTIRRWSMKRNTVHSFPQPSYIRSFAAFFSVDTKNWYRKGTDLWAEFGKEASFGKKFSSKDSVKILAVGSMPSFGRRTVCA